MAEEYANPNEVLIDIVWKRDEEAREVWSTLKSMNPDNKLSHDEWLEKINRVMDIVHHLEHLCLVEGVLRHDDYIDDIGVWINLDDYLYVENGKHVRL